MKKNILLLLMSLLFFMAADALAQEGCDEDSRFNEESSRDEDSCCDKASSCDEDSRPNVDSCCVKNSCCVDGTNFYAKIFGGANFLQSTDIDGNQSTYQTGYIIAGSLGYCWRYGLCLEAEYAYRRNGINQIDFFVEGFSNDGHYQASSYMANLLWDLPLSSWGCAFWDIQPFIGTGIGYDCHRMHAENSRVIFDQEWNHFSWQLMAGLAYPIFCNTEITLEYKFHQGSNHFYNHSVGVGLVYKFGFLN